MPRTGSGEPEVHHVTDAATAHSDDLDARITRYLLSMLVRTACVLLVFVVDGWPRWIFAVGAIALPYVAVVLANNGGRTRGRPDRVTALPHRALPAGASAVVLTGVVQPRSGEDAAGTSRPSPDGPDGPRTVPGTASDPLRDRG